MAELQAAVLSSSARYARPGAPITYSVCSLSRAEGPGVVEGALRAGLAHTGGGAVPEDVLTRDGDLLTVPHRHGTDGFYAARLAR
jgi:16S rRNA (cytosine967-C5)-methyltransferase